MADAQIRAVITADDRASSVLRNFGNTLDKSVSNSLEAAKAGSFALLGGLTALAGGAALLVNAFAESENVGAQLTAVLKSTGGAAGVTRDQAIGLSQALQATTTFSDEAVLSAENLLLTFTSIGKDIFPQATKTVLDMSIALGQDTKSSAIQLGKALQDPITGITALRRVGVNFSDAQQEVIANLVQTNRLADAQTMILQELNREFGGSATQAAATFTGQLKQLWNMINDVMEVMGKIIADAIRPFVQGLINAFNAMGGADGVAKALTDTLAKMKPYIPEIAGAILFGLVPAIVAMVGALGVLQPEFLLLLAAGALVGLVVKNMNLNFGDLKKVFDAFKPTIDAFLQAIPIYFNLLRQVFDFLKPSLDALWQTIVTSLWPALQNLWSALQPLLPVIGVAIVGALWLFINGLRILIEVVSVVIQISTAFANFFYTTLPNAFMGGINTIVGLVDYMKNHFWETVGFIIGFFAMLPFKILNFVATAITGAILWLLNVDWGGVLSGIGHAFENAWNWAKDAAVRAFNFMKNLDWGSLAVGVGKGIVNALNALVEGAINGALSGLPGKPTIHLPRFASGVQNFSGGMALVGERGPEIVNLPGGSDVIPNNKISQMGGQTSVNINLNGPFLGSGAEARAYAQMIVDNIKDIASAKNMTVAEVFS